MELSLYNNVSNLMTPLIGFDNLAITLDKLSDTNLQIKRIILGSRTFIARKERPTDLIAKDGKNAIIMLLNTNTEKVDVTKITDKLLVQNIQQSKIERAQVTETFQEKDPSIFFFGKRTTSYVFVGQLLNTDRDVAAPYNLYTNWTAGFQRYWDEHLRGTKLAENKKIAVMLVDDEMYEGYPVSLSINKSSMTEYTASFSMTWIITKHTSLLDNSHLDKFMFFSDDEKLKRVFDQLVLHDRQRGVFGDFVIGLGSYAPESWEAVGLAEAPLMNLEINNDLYFTDKKIVVGKNVIDADNEPGGPRIVECTTDFKNALRFIKHNLGERVDFWGEKYEGNKEISIDWAMNPEITSVKFNRLTWLTYRSALDAYTSFVEDLAKEYNTILNNLENEL